MFKLHPRNWLVNDTLWKTSHLIVGYWLNHGSYIYSSNGPTRVVTIISDGISTSDVSKLLCTPKGPAILSAGTSRTRCSSTSWNWGRWAWLWTQANFTGTLTALATTRDGSQSLIPCSHLVEQAIVNRRCRVRIAKSWKLVFATISQRVNCGNSRGFHHQVCQLRYQRPTFTSPAPKLSCRAMMPGRTWQTCKKRDSGWAASLFGLQSLDLLWATHLLMLFSKWFAQTWPTMPKHVESYQAPPDWSVALWSTPQSMTGRWSGRASNWVCHASVWLTPTSTRHTPWQQLPTCSLRMMGENCFHFFCKLVSDSPVSIIKTNVDSRNLLQIQVLVFGRTGRAVWGWLERWHLATNPLLKMRLQWLLNSPPWAYAWNKMGYWSFHLTSGPSIWLTQPEVQNGGSCSNSLTANGVHLMTSQHLHALRNAVINQSWVRHRDQPLTKIQAPGHQSFLASPQTRTPWTPSMVRQQSLSLSVELWLVWWLKVPNCFWSLLATALRGLMPLSFALGRAHGSLMPEQPPLSRLFGDDFILNFCDQKYLMVLPFFFELQPP